MTLLRDGHVVGKRELFESLSYQDETYERVAFKKEFGLVSVHFSTVLFYRLAMSFYRSIEAGILESVGAKTRQEDDSALGEENTQTTSAVEDEEDKTGFLTIESSPDSAEILLDGKLIATTPAKQLRLPSGRHVLILRKVGYQDWVREVMVLGGNDLTLKATLEKSTDKK